VGDGPARLIATDYFAPTEDGQPARIRAYAGFDPDRMDPKADPFSQIGRGYFALLLDQGPGTLPYQGITPISGGSLCGLRGGLFRPVRTAAHALRDELRPVLAAGGANRGAVAG
jgi:hypothetical protein